MAQHLLDRGYRRFGYIASQGGNDLRAAKRFEAFSERVRSAGAQIYDHRMAGEASSMIVGRCLTEDILAQQTRPEVLYYSNDDLAAGGLMHCLAHCIDVPKAIALAGFNGLSFLSALPMQITTTRTPRYEIGVAAANWLSGAANEQEPPSRCELPTTLVVGQTT